MPHTQKRAQHSAPRVSDRCARPAGAGDNAPLLRTAARTPPGGRLLRRHPLRPTRSHLSDLSGRRHAHRLRKALRHPGLGSRRSLRSKEPKLHSRVPRGVTKQTSHCLFLERVRSPNPEQTSRRKADPSPCQPGALRGAGRSAPGQLRPAPTRGGARPPGRWRPGPHVRAGTIRSLSSKLRGPARHPLVPRGGRRHERDRRAPGAAL